MKKFFAIALAVLAVNVSAQNQRKVGDIIEIGDLNYKVTSLNPATAEVTESPFAEGEIEILTEFDDYDVHYTVNKIGSLAFYNGYYNEAISGTLTIPEGIEEIEWQAFIGCYRIDSISLPSTLEKIGSSAFYCFNDKPSALHAVRCAAVMPPQCGEMVFGSRFNAEEGHDRSRIVLWVPVGSVQAYRAEKQWDYFNYIIDFDGQESSTVDEHHYNPDPDQEAIDEVISKSVKCHKFFENGMLIIERNGERFNVLGSAIQ